MRNNKNAYHYLGLKFRQQKRYKDEIRWRDKYKCQICGGPGYDVDHIVPFHISQDSSPSNLRVLCHKCNLIARQNPRANPFETMEDWYKYLEAELGKCEPY